MVDDTSRGYAEKLFHAAGRHQYALEQLLPDDACADEPVGFHACQSVWKMLAAVLSLASVRHRETQDLSELIDLVRENIRGTPEELEEVRRLSSFGDGQAIYSLEASRLDRCRVLHCVRAIRHWAHSTRDALDPEGTHKRESDAIRLYRVKAALGIAGGKSANE